MLSKTERDELEEKLKTQQKKVMREILNLGEFSLPQDKFAKFKHIVFDNFGLSGLETKTKEALDEFTEKGE